MKKYDLIIVSHERDFFKIKYCLEYANKNLDDFESIHLILSERKEYKDKALLKNFINKPIFYHNESDILKIDKNRIMHRPNWIYQMLLKMFQNVTKNDNFLVIESDVIINKKLSFFENGKTLFYLGFDQHHEPYFNFNRKILNIGREYNHFFISEFMMYDKNIVKEILEKSNSESIDDFKIKLYDTITNDCYPADYELYGNFFYKYHFDEFDIRYTNTSQNRKYGILNNDYWSDNEIVNLIDSNKNSDIISFHTYKEEI